MKSNPLYRLVPYLSRYRGRLALGFLTVLGTTLMSVISPWVLKYVVDGIRTGQTIRPLWVYASLIIGASAAEGVFRFAMRELLIGVSRDVEYDLRNDFFSHLQRLSLSFFQRTRTGDIMSRGTNDLGAVRMVLGPGIMYSMNTAIMAVFTISLLLSMSWWLTLVALIPLSLLALSVKVFGQQIHSRFERIQDQFSHLSNKVQENAAGIRVVKSFVREESEIADFRKLNEEYMRRSLSLVRVWGLFHPMLALLMGLSTLLLLWLGGRAVVQGTLTLGELVAFLSYLTMLAWPTIALGWVINIFQRGAASMERVNHILDEQPEICSVKDAAERTFPLAARRNLDIEFERVSFGYRLDLPLVIKDLSLHIPYGTFLAIVGATGSGKTTLINLLPRLFDVTSGAIRLGGLDLSHWSLEALRSRFGIIAQDTFLFSESVRDNIALGWPAAPQDPIEQAVRFSNIYTDILEFPEQLRTRVGERGITLSGGQKQRIAIARAILLDADILIFDDAFSSVDTVTEEAILANLVAMNPKKTCLLVSHRISTVKNADHIIVLEHGQIVEQGTHNELMEERGYYYELYQKQLLEEELAVS